MEEKFAKTGASVNVNNCGECSNLRYDKENECFCVALGVERMIEEGTWAKFNKDFRSGDLFKFIIESCPFKV